MSNPHDIQVTGAALYFLPVQMRVPMKFGREVTTCVTCARVRVRVRDDAGNLATGWGETPLSVQWTWPGELPYDVRLQAMQEFCKKLTAALNGFGQKGHPIELGYRFMEQALPGLLREFNARRGDDAPPMPRLAALICFSAFDIAIHDAYGVLNQRPTFELYGKEFLGSDLSTFLKPAQGSGVNFAGRYPADYLSPVREKKLPAWHLVGGLDPLEKGDPGENPNDGYPFLLSEWIERDGLRHLKIKLRGNDAQWDFDRICRVGKMAIETGALWLSADFNCTVDDPAYVNEVLDRLLREAPRTYALLLYVEQPFPYDLEANQIDVRAVSARKPLFMDESAHDWHLVKLGRSLGWSGVALKTCKSMTGAILMQAWAQAHDMPIMVQDLSNPMLAQISHVLLAAHARTIAGVETNGMQFYPDASAPEARIQPGLYKRNDGMLDTTTMSRIGLGYRVDEIHRALPPLATASGEG